MAGRDGTVTDGKYEQPFLFVLGMSELAFARRLCCNSRWRGIGGDMPAEAARPLVTEGPPRSWAGDPQACSALCTALFRVWVLSDCRAIFTVKSTWDEQALY